MDQLTGEYKKPCLSPPMPPHLSSSMSPALAGGLRSQTCSPGWLASLIKEDRFFSFSFPPSLSLFLFFFLGLLLGKVEPVLWGQGEDEEGPRDYRQPRFSAPRVQDTPSLRNSIPCPWQAASWGHEKRHSAPWAHSPGTNSGAQHPSGDMAD